MSQTNSPSEPGPTGWVKFEDGGSNSPTGRSPNKKSPTSSGVSSARGSVTSISAAAEPVAVNGQPGALAVSEIQVSQSNIHYILSIHAGSWLNPGLHYCNYRSKLVHFEAQKKIFSMFKKDLD